MIRGMLVQACIVERVTNMILGLWTYTIKHGKTLEERFLGRDNVASGCAVLLLFTCRTCGVVYILYMLCCVHVLHVVYVVLCTFCTTSCV